MPDRVPVVLCFDVEPDEVDLRPGPAAWLGFERLLDRIESLREELAEATGRPARFNWFLRMDPQIAGTHGAAGWVVDRYGREIDDLRSAGDGIGLHPHAWRWSARRDGWVAENADAEWVDECIRVSYEAYEAALGEPCRIQRFGDRLMTARAARLSEALGAWFDLTIEPGAGPLASMHPGMGATGGTADMRSAPRWPYRPGPDDIMRPGDGKLWMIPLTSMDPDPMLPAWRRVARRLRHPGTPRHRPTTLTAAWPAAAFWQMVERELAAMAVPYLAFAIRSDAPVVAHLIRPIEEKFAALLASPLVSRLEFATPDAVVGVKAGAVSGRVLPG